MGTELRLELGGVSRDRALAASEAAVRTLESVERRLSTWRPDSELARLNAAPVGEPVPLGEELAEDLHLAERWWRLTDGAFDPAVGRLVQAWGVREGGRGSVVDRTEPEPGSFTLSALRLEDRAATRLDAALVLEEGGFGKGVGLDAALDELRAHSIPEVLLDLGGQIAFRTGETALWLAIADPRDRARTLAEIELRGEGSLATSGNGERAILVDGERLSHILDPRTGRPAPDFGSVTVLAKSAAVADCLSTALFVLGPEGAIDWWRAHSEIRSEFEFLLFIASEEGDRVTATPGLRHRLRRPASGLALHHLSTSDSE